MLQWEHDVKVSAWRTYMFLILDKLLIRNRFPD